MLVYCQLALWNEIQWNINGKSNIFNQENAFENIFSKMVDFFIGFNAFIHGDGNLNIIRLDNKDNGLAPDCHQATNWNNAGILLIGPSGINFTEIVI